MNVHLNNKLINSVTEVERMKRYPIVLCRDFGESNVVTLFDRIHVPTLELPIHCRHRACKKKFITKIILV